MEYEIIKNKIVYFKKVIPNHKEIVDCIENTSNHIITEWMPWGNKYATSIQQAIASNEYGICKSLYSPFFDEPGTSKDYYWVYESISKALEQCSSIYKDIMKIDESTNPRLMNKGFVVGKYDINGLKGLHTDCDYDDLEHSYVMYLNDNYDGGELNFPELDITFKPEAGSVVMFKSNDVDNVHQVWSVKSGHKYIIPHFWRMGPSQGFIPYGWTIEKYLEMFSNKDNITNNFEGIERVNKLMKYNG